MSYFHMMNLIATAGLWQQESTSSPLVKVGTVYLFDPPSCVDLMIQPNELTIPDFPDQKEPDRGTPLHAVLFHSDSGRVDLLLAHGVDPTIK